MPGMYSHNKFFMKVNWAGADALEVFEDVVHAEDVIQLSSFDAYAIAIEESWPNFIQEQSL